MQSFFSRLGVFIFICIGTIASYGQVKIGAFPETINPSSLLELESSSKVLVISRVDTAQMNAIVPLEGAMVYNTDAQCLHYYNGTEWVNICEAFGDAITFTSDPITNPGNFESIKITQTDNNYNFEVSLINGSNIQPGTVDTEHITNGAVTQNKIRDGQINSQKIADKSIQTIDIAPGLSNTVLQSNGTTVAWAPLDASVVTGRDLTAGDGSITITDGGFAILKAANVRVADSGITTPKLADSAITTAKILDETILSGDILDGTIATVDLANDAVTAAKINADVAGVGLEKDATSGALDVLVDNSTIEVDTTNGLQVKDNGVTPLKIEASLAGAGISRDATTGVLSVNGAGVAGDGNITSTDLDVTGDTNALLGDVIIDIKNGAVTAAKINSDVAGGGLEKDATSGALDVLVDNSTIEIDATSGLVQVKNIGITATKINSDVAGAGLVQNVTTGALEADASLATDAEVTAAIATSDAADLDKIIGNEITNSTDGTLVRSGTGTTASPYTLDIATGAITTTELASNAVTTIKIADANVTPAKIAPSVTNGQVLTTVASVTTWQTPASPFHALGKMNTSLVTNGSNIGSVLNLGTGNYQVNFTTPATSANYIIQLTLLNALAGSTIQVTAQAVGSFTVQISNDTPAALDADWYFTVTDF